MSLAHALMISLLEKPSSGYDLAQRFDKSIGYFWTATHQQIYRELGRMVEKGWVDSDAAPGHGRTDKRTYQVLDAGRDELIRWAREPSEPVQPRHDLLVRLRADARLGPLGLNTEIERLLHHHRARLQAYRAIEQRDFAEGKTLDREARLQHMILKTGIMYEEGWAHWCAEMLQVLADTDTGTDTEAGSRGQPQEG